MQRLLSPSGRGSARPCGRATTSTSSTLREPELDRIGALGRQAAMKLTYTRRL
ncbi:MAG: hypothetical protein WD031_01630 [Gemmatimonadota bacterium]